MSAIRVSLVILTDLSTCTCTLYICLDARPPPMDPSDSAVEFSQTHFSRDDDLISLQIEPHRYECSVHVNVHCMSTRLSVPYVITIDVGFMIIMITLKIDVKLNLTLPNRPLSQ